MFSSVATAKQRGESPKLLTKHSILVIAEFELYYIYTHTHVLFISELFLIHKNHSEINMDYSLFFFFHKRGKQTFTTRCTLIRVVLLFAVQKKLFDQPTYT